MNVYKAFVTVELVMTATNSADAVDVLKHNLLDNLDGMTFEVKELDRIKSEDELPEGWTGDDLAFMASNAKSIDEQKISWHLKNPSTK